MAWWAWIILGFVLLLAELITPGGFFLMFFGIGALVVGLLAAVGLGEPTWLQWLLFSGISLGSLALFRRPLVERFGTRSTAEGGPTLDTDTLVGEKAVALEPIAPGSIGRVEARGAAWTARNDGAEALASGERCVVVQVKGLTLDVRAAETRVEKGVMQ